MRKNILALAILGSLSASAFAQDPRNSDIKVTADIHAGCDLTAENINFGVLMMPLTNSTAQANMNVKCSKGANLEIAINYSENASSSSSNLSNYRLEYSTGSGADGDAVKIYDANDNTILGALNCHRNPTGAGWSGIAGVELKSGFFNSIGLPSTITGNWQPDTYGVCSETPEGLKLNTAVLLGTSIGALTGLTSGEQIKYSLSLPGNDSQIWSSSSKHTVSATGVEQTIPMKANIKRADNPTYRMTPDTYQSILTVVLTY